MRIRTVLSSAVAGVLLTTVSAMATPINSLSPLSSNGTDVYGVYVFSEARDALNLSEIGPNSVSNFFCNYSNGGCTAASVGDTVYLGATPPGIVFGLEDVTAPNSYRTDALGPDGYAHDLVSATVDASDSAAVAGAYSIFGQGALDPMAAAAIAAIGLTPGSVVTFVGWEDRVGGDYDYNDLIFAFTDPPVDRLPVPEPSTLAMFALGFAGLAASQKRRRVLKPSRR